jgi:hypothetical protein
MDKQRVHQVVDEFPDEVDIRALSYKLYVLESIELGEKDFDEGRFLTQEEVKKRFARWLGGDQCPGRDS